MFTIFLLVIFPLFDWLDVFGNRLSDNIPDRPILIELVDTKQLIHVLVNCDL